MQIGGCGGVSSWLPGSYKLAYVVAALTHPLPDAIIAFVFHPRDAK
jgi:hypothetical protein